MFKVLIGDNRDTLRTLPDGSVHCCVTSPPYWGLRDYGHADQLGLEKTPEEYVASMVAVFREVRRVLRDDGTLWLNLGDSYAGSWGNYGGQNRGNGTQREIVNGSAVPNPAYDGRERDRPPTASVPGLKPKDLVGIPWRVAFALQADGWYLRSDIIWAKPNPMPESVTDRPTKAHEYLFLLTKSPRYFYDAEAIKEASNAFERQGTNRLSPKSLEKQSLGHFSGKTGFVDPYAYPNRNRRSVWTVATQSYSGAHFATFPAKLIEPCIKAGTSENGCCPTCGAGRARVVETEKEFQSGSGRSGNVINGKQDLSASPTNSTPDIRKGPVVRSTTIGWQPTCDCEFYRLRDDVPEPIKDELRQLGFLEAQDESQSVQGVRS